MLVRSVERRLSRIGVPATVVATAVVALVVASPALAHATLVSTSPGNEAVLARAPAQVALTFDDDVEKALGSIQVTDDSGRRVDDGPPTQPDPKEFTVGLQSGLPRGTYSVSWRVISDDGHPVDGTSSFSIGRPSGAATGPSPEVPTAQAGSGAVDVTFGVVRFLNFALIVLCAGGALVLAYVLAGESTDVRRPLWWILSLAGLSLAVASLAGIGLEGAQASRLGLGSAFKPSLFGDVFDTRFGKVWFARGWVALVFALVAVLALGSRRRERAFTGVAVALAIAIALTPALSGHAQDEGAVAVLSDWVHVASAAAWIGGLAFVLVALLVTSGSRWHVASRVVPRFSSLAVVAVAALLAAGVVNSLFEIPALSDLWSTTYGRLLLVKIGLVLPLLGLGAFNNRFSVPRLRAGIASALERRRFLVTVGIELSIVVAVLGVTAALVAETPARAEQPAATGPVAREIAIGPYALDVYVDPARAGENAIHLTLFDPDTTRPARVQGIDVSASLPSDGRKPPLQTLAAGPGHVVVVGEFPEPGDWQLQIGVREPRVTKGGVDRFRTYVAKIAVPIGTAS